MRMFKCLSKDVNSFKGYIMLYCKVVVLHDVMKYVVGNNDCVKINIHCTHICVFSSTIVRFFKPHNYSFCLFISNIRNMQSFFTTLVMNLLNLFSCVMALIFLKFLNIRRAIENNFILKNFHD